MTFGKRVSENQGAKPKRANNEIPARYWVPVLGVIAIGIGLEVFSRVVANMPPDGLIAIAAEPSNK